MPPFSGKKKKEQLKAKRARKRAQHEDELARSSAQERQYEQQQQQQQHDEDSDSDTQRAAPALVADDTFVYGADRAGVRSAFRRETRDEVAARQRSNYAPLRHRVFMTTAGIPFGQWLLMHGAVQSATAPASESFPFALQLPLRGWHVNSGDECNNDNNDTIVVEDARDDDDTDDDDEDDDTARATRPTTDAAHVERVEARRFVRYLAALEDANAPWRKTLDRVTASTRTSSNSSNSKDDNDGTAPLQLTSYERNIDVWRQLWRAVEACDVCVLVADARYPPVHVHLGLLHYITRTQRTPCVVLLNKMDLVPAAVLARWRLFLARYLTRMGFAVCDDDAAATSGEEGDKDKEGGGAAAAAADAATRGCIVLRSFTANPRPETATGADDDVDVTRRRRKGERRRGKLYAQLRSGKLNATTDDHSNSSDDNDDDDDDTAHELTTRYAASTNFKGMAKAERALQHGTRTHRELQAVSAAITELLALCRRLGRQRRRSCGNSSNNTDNARDAHATQTERNDDDDDDVHIAFVGFPNVGKSSLLNCISATKVVSVSATPGHTKHMQTMRVAQEKVTLIDTPGLALPMCGLPRPLQAVIGTHQIAQTRDPQSGVAYLAAHLPLEKLYGLRRPDGAVDDDDDSANDDNTRTGSRGVARWCAYDFCEAYAQKRGYYVKHGKGAPDVHRAAIALLQEAYEGRLVLFFAPPPLQLLDDDDFVRRIQPCLLLPVLDDDRQHTPPPPPPS